MTLHGTKACNNKLEHHPCVFGGAAQGVKRGAPWRPPDIGEAKARDGSYYGASNDYQYNYEVHFRYHIPYIVISGLWSDNIGKYLGPYKWNHKLVII